MNITIVGPFPPFRGGISHFNSALTRTLSQKHSVNIINFSIQYPKILFPGKTQYEEASIVSDVSSERLLSSVNPFSWIKTANKIISQKVDLIVFMYWMPFFAPAYGKIVHRLKRHLNSKILAICHNIIPHEPHWYDTLLTQYFFNEVNCFIVMAKSVEKNLLELYPEANYKYSPHPVYDIFGETINKTSARQALGITAQKVILYFGYIRRYKGVDLLIEATVKLKDRLENFMVIAVGDCYKDKQRYINLVEKNGLSDLFDLRMQFVPDSDVALYFSAADIVTLPYKTATQSGIVNIAYHFNKPVVVTDVGGLAEIVPHREVGYVVEAENPNAIAEAIFDFFENDRSEFMVNNVAEHKKKFSWNTFTKTIESFFED